MSYCNVNKAIPKKRKRGNIINIFKLKQKNALTRIGIVK